MIIIQDKSWRKRVGVHETFLMGIEVHRSDLIKMSPSQNCWLGRQASTFSCMCYLFTLCLNFQKIYKYELTIYCYIESLGFQTGFWFWPNVCHLARRPNQHFWEGDILIQSDLCTSIPMRKVSRAPTLFRHDLPLMIIMLWLGHDF